MPNTNFQTIHQMGNAISRVVKQATGRDPVENIDMDYVTVAQNKTFGEMVITGNPASFHTGNSVPLQRILIGMEPIQPGSGDPSPDNIRPISGRTGVNISRYGKNMFPCLLSSIKASNTTGTWTGNTYSVRGIEFKFSEQDGYVTSIKVSGTATGIAIVRIYSNNTGIPANNYIANGCPSGGSSSTYYQRLHDVNSSSGGTTKFDYGAGVSVDDTYIIKRVNVTVGQGTTVSGLIFRPMIRLASIEDDDFEPYTGENYSVTFPDPPGTVYGGTVDIISGVLTVNTYMWTPNFNTPWFIDNDDVFTTTLPHPKESGLNKAICSHFIAETNNENSRLTLKDTGFSTLEGIRQYAQDQRTAGTPIQILYELATPVSYRLTPQEIATLIGDNVISTDGDTLEVMYYINTGR